MKPLSDLIPLFQITPQKGSERGELLKYFATKVDRPIKIVAIRCSHYTLDQLYALRSGYLDRLRTSDREGARKWWWWTTKTAKVIPTSPEKLYCE